MKRSLRLRAFAKANLSLNITGKAGGLHTLDSVMVSLDAFDTVTVTERDDDMISVKFLNADVDPVRNTAYKAAQSVRSEIGCGGFDIEIEKGIPVGAGLGGSSADGAAVLRALDLLYRLPARGVDMRKTALKVGSDVPFMLTGGTARVKGSGDDMFFVDNKLDLFAIGLISESVSTAEAYAQFDRMCGDALCPTDNDALIDDLLDGKASALERLGNALYAPACALAPSVERNSRILRGAGASACMTGSGGMALGWFTDIEAFARAAVALKGEDGYRVFSKAPVGILHEWLIK